MVMRRSASRIAAVSMLDAKVDVESEVPPTSSVEDAESWPATWSWAPMEEEALEMKPPCNVERFFTSKVLDAFRAPATCNPAPTELDALEMNPP